MRNKLTNSQIVILDYLNSQENPVTTHEITTHTKYSYNLVARNVARLSELKCIKREFAGTGHQYIYTYLTHEPWQYAVSAHSQKTKKAAPSVDPVPPIQILTDLIKWSSNGWQPKIRDMIWNFSEVISRLAVFDSLSAIHGEQIDQLLIEEQKDKLNELLQMIRTLEHTISRLLTTEGLWEFNKLSGFFTEHINPEELLTKAKTVESLRVTEGDIIDTQS